MKLRALRLNEVGCFTKPVALEGLSGGLDVLAGPNELGKSTLFRALHAVLFEDYGSQKQAVQALRSLRDGAELGAPLIELDFEIAGRGMRLRKRFLSGKTAANALLSDLQSGAELARGADVELQLRQLLGRTAPGHDPFGLVFVGQTEALADVSLSAEQQSGQIEALVADEIEKVSDGGIARSVLAVVEARLGTYFTPKGGLKKVSDYQRALAKSADLAAALQLAEQRLTAAGQTLEQLNMLRSERDQLVNPVAVNAREVGFSEAEQELARMREITAGLSAADERLAHARAAFAQAEAARCEFASLLGEVAQLDAATSADRLGIDELQRRMVGLQGSEAELRARHEVALVRRRDLGRASQALQLRQQLNVLEARLAQANAARVTHGRLAAQMRGDENIPARVAAAQKSLRELESLRARLLAGAPRLKLHYLPGSEGRMRLDGQALPGTHDIHVMGPTVIEIDGVGQIEIIPARNLAGEDGGEGTRQDGRELLGAAEARLQADLSALSCVDIAGAEARAEAHRQLETELRRWRDELQRLAPGGIAQLEAEIARHRAASTPTPTVTPAATSASTLAAPLPEDIAELDGDAIAAAIADLDVASRGIELDREKNLAELRQAEIKLAGLQAAHQARVERSASLHAQLGAIADTQSHAQSLVARETAARDQLRSAQNDHDARQRLRPSQQEMQELERNRDQALGRQEDARQRIIEIEKLIERLDGQLQRDREEGLGESVLELEGNLALAQRNVARFQADMAALKRLQTVLNESRDDTRNRYLKPVEARMLPYLQLLFPQARLRFDAKFGINDLVRPDRSDALSRLSIGTREQLAILVRLGFASLLAEKGRPTPVVLDDALVYSDDERIARMFAALELASQSHQVIVLTCRSRSFERLGGHRLELVPCNFG